MNALAQPATPAAPLGARLRRLPTVAAACAVLVGALTSLGWLLDVTAFKSILTSLPPMKLNTAASFVLTGLALWTLCPAQPARRLRWPGRAAALIVALVGLLTLTEYLFGWDWRIDLPLYRALAIPGATMQTARMAPHSALNFLLTGLALLLIERPSRRAQRIGQLLAFLILIVAWLALIGHSYDVTYFYGGAQLTAMALHTALTFIVLGFGLLATQPQQGLFGVLTGAGTGSLLARRLLPAAIIVPFVLGWLRVLGERAQLYDSAFGAALMVTQSLVIFVALVWRAAVQLNHADAERMHAEEALRRSHEELETKVATRTAELRFQSHLLDTAEQAVIATDPGGQIIYWNSFAEKLYGWTATEAVGRNIVEITPAAESLAQSTEIMNRLSRGQSWAGEFNVRRRDGTVFPAQVTDTPILDAAGRLVGIVGVSNDISTRKQAERERELLLARERSALAEVERRLRESDQLTALYRELTGAVALHEVTAAICRAVRAIVGADGAAFVLSEGEEVYYADENAIAPLWQGRRFPVAACTAGWSITERQPVIIEDIYQDPRVPIEAYRATFVKGMLMIPVRSVSPVGAIGAYWAVPHLATDDELRLMRALASAADLAFSNSQLYEQMKRAQLEAETASRLKDDFLATVSHELRTPMTAILGWAHLLQAGTLDEAMHGRALKTIERNAQAQAQLIEDLLDVSRIITGKLRLDVRPVALAPIIAAAVEAVRPAAAAKGVTLCADAPAAVPHVLGDANRLQQVIWNLLANAIKFTPPGGAVRIALAECAAHAEVSVCDTGQGIAPEFLPHVFERFRQADASPTRMHGGLGLGLAIVRHLVELHGGTVAADSGGEGAGATFKVQLPLAELRLPDARARTGADAPNQTETAEGRVETLAGLRVLVVDDEADTRELLRLALTQSGALVTTADSTNAALAALAGERPDLLISDIGMQGADGYTLIREVRAREAQHGLARLPAVALTAYARPEDQTQALAAGFHLHIRKPVEPVELIAALARLTERQG